MDDTLQEYQEALIKIDELSMMLGRTLSNMRVGWDEEFGESSKVLNEINNIARQIGCAIPASIKDTRPILPRHIMASEKWMETPLKLV